MKPHGTRYLVLIAGAFFYLLTAIPPLHAADGALKKIRVGYPSASASFYPLFVTKEAGLFEKYGLSPEIVFVQGVQLIQVHVAGQLDFGVVSGLVTLQAAVGGADLTLLASSIDNHLMKIMAHAGISTPSDLKGKTIGITRLGSLTDLVARPVLAGWGLDPKKDVTFVQIGGQGDIARAVSLRKVDAGVLSFPTSFFAEKMGLKTLYDLADSGVEITTTTVSASREYIKANREVVLRFLKAYVEGTHRLLTDRELAIKALRKYGGIQDPELLAKTYELFATKYIKKIPILTSKGVESALSLAAETNPKARSRKPSEFMDTSFMEELEKSGFIRSVWR